MSSHTTDRLIFNFGFLLDGPLGEHRRVEIDYPAVKLDDVTLTPLKGYFRASKTAQGIFLKGTLKSQLTSIICSRCMTLFEQEVNILLDDHFYVKNQAPDGEYVVGDNGMVDIGPLVRELSLVSVPLQPVCKSDCIGLCIECGQNLNEADCGCEEETIDPRMAVLKQLLEDKEGE